MVAKFQWLFLRESSIKDYLDFIFLNINANLYPPPTFPTNNYLYHFG